MPDESAPAFPQPVGREPGYGRQGMSLREWYAGLAMQGVLAACCADPRATPSEGELSDVARGSVKMADALIAALAEGK